MTMSTARSEALEAPDGGQHHEQAHRLCVIPITALPEPLLERILISCTRTRKDKKALRQTCRQFQQILDSSLVCLKMTTAEDGRQQYQEKFLKRMQQLPTMKSMGFAEWNPKAYSLFTHLPTQLTMLDFVVGDIDVKGLARLPCLTTLSLRCFSGKVTGLGHISGLTSLHCGKPVDCVTHLAPTLKRLSIENFKDVKGTDQLTNLEILNVTMGMPTNIFQTHRMLPLKHISIGVYDDNKFFTSRTLWESAPTTLTSLTWIGNREALPDVLPKSITHLQLVHAVPAGLKAAPAALPWLKRLDILDYASIHNSSAFLCLSNFTGLQCLRMCMEDHRDGDYWNRQQVLSKLQGVAMAVKGGVALEVITTQSESGAVFLGGLKGMQTAWATRFS